MNEYICGVKLESEDIEMAAREVASPYGINSIMMAETVHCMNTNTFDANIAGLSFFFVAVIGMGIGIVLGAHKR